MDERTHARYMADIAYFLSKMEAEPNSGYFIPIALAYNKLEKYDETIAMCKTAVERFPSNCAAKTFLAEAYVYKGLFDQARELLFDVTAEDDNNYKALKLLGIICKEKGDNTEALKYLTGAFIRSPEDEEVRKMIDELGGTLNPGQIYDERMKHQSQSAAESEEDEDLKTYQEIDKRIRNAEIIMADLVSDTSISARNYEEEEDFHSDDPNDYMPLITKHEEEEGESLSGNPDDFLPQITKSEENEELEHVETLSNDEEREDLTKTLSSEEENSSEDLASALQEEQEHNQTSEDNSADDLLSALSSEEESEEIEDNAELSELEEETEIVEDTLNETEYSQDTEENLEESIKTVDETDSKDKELLKKQVPSSFGSMTYDDMIDDDFQYGKIVDESYKDSDNPSIDLGESAPFTQSDIMDEILNAVGMTHDDMADDEKINISEKDRKLMRLENLLEKVQHNKESE